MSVDQWVVDETGLTGAGYYWIEAKRLHCLRGEFYEWPLQVHGKNWVNFPAFCIAFEQALRVHRARYSKSRLAATIHECIKRQAESDEFYMVELELFPERHKAKIHRINFDELGQVDDELQRRREDRWARHAAIKQKLAA